MKLKRNLSTIVILVAGALLGDTAASVGFRVTPGVSAAVVPTEDTAATR
jgi:hypothetical protein